MTFSTPAMKENKIIQHANLIALFAGLVFVAHPVQTEAVTYIVQRATSMAALFYVASLCLYVKSRLLQESGSAPGPWKLYYIGSLLTAIAAMFTKQIAITLPLAILLYEFSFFKNVHWKRLIPLLLTISIIPLIMLLPESAQSQHIRGDRPADISSIHYFLTQFRVMVTYIRLVFLPLNQNLDYDFSISKSIFEVPTLLGFLFLAGIIFIAKYLFSKYRLLSFSIFWFFLTLLPESSFFPIKDVIFEHRLYLPLVGYSMFLVSSVYYLFGQNTVKTMVKILTVVIVCNSILTYQRNKVWENEFTLWNDAVGKSPHKARPYTNRGAAYSSMGGFIQAIRDYNKSIEINPDFNEVAYYNRGNYYSRQNQLTQAIADYNKAINISPGYLEAYTNRGHAYYQKGDFNQAISDYSKAIAINPNYAIIYLDRGLAYAKEGNLILAVSDYKRAIAIDPAYAQAR